jgi:hypothetical protein
MNDVNTQSCEQIDRGLKYVAPILNNSTHVRHKILLLTLSHYHNCRQLNMVHWLNTVSFNLLSD